MPVFYVTQFFEEGLHRPYLPGMEGHGVEKIHQCFSKPSGQQFPKKIGSPLKLWEERLELMRTL
jgi:hypothetical protein